MGHIKDKLRMAEWGFASALLLLMIAFAAPQQLPVVLYKVALVTLFAHLGYWIDRRLFPDSRPGDLLDSSIDYHKAGLRRAITVAAVIVAGALAL